MPILTSSNSSDNTTVLFSKQYPQFATFSVHTSYQGYYDEFADTSKVGCIYQMLEKSRLADKKRTLIRRQSSYYFRSFAHAYLPMEGLLMMESHVEVIPYKMYNKRYAQSSLLAFSHNQLMRKEQRTHLS